MTIIELAATPASTLNMQSRLCVKCLNIMTERSTCSSRQWSSQGTTQDILLRCQQNAQSRRKISEYHNLLLKTSRTSAANCSLSFQKSGMNSSKFSKCLESEKYKNEVDSDTSQGYLARVSERRLFHQRARITGKPFRTFKTIIDRS